MGWAFIFKRNVFFIPGYAALKVHQLLSGYFTAHQNSTVVFSLQLLIKFSHKPSVFGQCIYRSFIFLFIWYRKKWKNMSALSLIPTQLPHFVFSVKWSRNKKNVQDVICRNKNYRKPSSIYMDHASIMASQNFDPESIPYSRTHR